MPVPNTNTFSLQDVRNIPQFILNRPDSLAEARTLALATSGSLPFAFRFDRRYAVGAINRLSQFRSYGAGGLPFDQRIAGSPFNSFTFNWQRFLQLSGYTVEFARENAGDGASWFSISPTSSSASSGTATVNILVPNTSGSAINGRVVMRIRSGATVYWENSFDFNLPST